jgi:hypothetical protein
MSACGIAPEDDDGNAATAAKPQKLEVPSKIEPGALKKHQVTYYNLEELEGEKLTVAEHYLLVNQAKRLSETMWKSPAKLEKLTQFIDEGFKEDDQA